jgi:hypothetical protein
MNIYRIAEKGLTFKPYFDHVYVKFNYTKLPDIDVIDPVFWIYYKLMIHSQCPVIHLENLFSKMLNSPESDIDIAIDNFIKNKDKYDKFTTVSTQHRDKLEKIKLFTLMVSQAIDYCTLSEHDYVIDYLLKKEQPKKCNILLCEYDPRFLQFYDLKDLYPQSLYNYDWLPPEFYTGTVRVEFLFTEYIFNNLDIVSNLVVIQSDNSKEYVIDMLLTRSPEFLNKYFIKIYELSRPIFGNTSLLSNKYMTYKEFEYFYRYEGFSTNDTYTETPSMDHFEIRRYISPDPLDIFSRSPKQMKIKITDVDDHEYVENVDPKMYTMDDKLIGIQRVIIPNIDEVSDECLFGADYFM